MGHIWPVKAFHPARKAILLIMKESNIFLKNLLIWYKVTCAETITLWRCPALELLCTNLCGSLTKSLETLA